MTAHVNDTVLLSTQNVHNVKSNLQFCAFFFIKHFKSTLKLLFVMLTLSLVKKCIFSRTFDWKRSIIEKLLAIIARY